MPPPLLEVRGLCKSYEDRSGPLTVLSGLSFRLDCGGIMSLTGPSGSGKSTLLHIIGLLDDPGSGEVLYMGENTASWPRRRRDEYRAVELGFVFQNHLLLPEFSLLENVTLPLARREGRGGGLMEKGLAMLERLSLASRAHARPAELSGGERQRGAIARAMLHGPRLLLLDEPTGNLDPGVGREIMESVIGLCRSEKRGAILVTHNRELAALADESCELREHRLRRMNGKED